VNNLVMIYDAECQFCQGWVNWIQERDTTQKIEFLPCQSEERKKRFPRIDETECLKAMVVGLPGGALLRGADGAPHLLEALPGWKWAASLFRIPGVLWIARPIYRFIAKNRKLFSRGSTSCHLP
jgi:predicted DCC family thiol-disulfide oxidoreductase YuxK